MPLYDLNDFMRLSEVLSLQLSIPTVGRHNIASVILHRKNLPERDCEVLHEVLVFLGRAYGERRRRMGPMAVLHPIRATALLARAMDEVSLLDLLACLLHDKFEDLTPADLGEANWSGLNEDFKRLLARIDPREEWFLMERLDWLTRKKGDSYFRYVGRLLEQASRTPEIIRIKLADRLDNTLDMHVELEDPMSEVDFYSTLFQILFVNSFQGYKPGIKHPPVSPLNGAERLYQLFKSAVLISLIRERGVMPQGDGTSETLFHALVSASMKEAQRILMHVIGYHQTDLAQQRGLLMDVMEYSQLGLMGRVTLPDKTRRLDGFSLSTFKDSVAAERKKSLARLYADKDLMIEAALAFVIIFQSFLNDPDFRLAGISADGIHAAD